MVAGAALLRAAPARAAGPRRLLVADRPRAAADLRLVAAPHRPVGLPLLLVAEGPAPGAQDVWTVSPRALLHLPPKRLMAMLRGAGALHVAAPAGDTAPAGDEAVGAAMLRLLRLRDAVGFACALALPTARERDALRVGAAAAGWEFDSI